MESNFLREVYNDPQFKKLREENPLAAKYMFEDYRKSWGAVLKDYESYRNKLREDNKGSWGKGKVFATVPTVIVDWLKFKLGHYPTKEELYDFVKKHSEFWTRDAV